MAAFPLGAAVVETRSPYKTRIMLDGKNGPVILELLMYRRGDAERPRPRPVSLIRPLKYYFLPDPDLNASPSSTGRRVSVHSCPILWEMYTFEATCWRIYDRDGLITWQIFRVQKCFN